MSKSKGESVSVDMSEAVKSAPSAKGKKLGAKGQPMEKVSEEKASMAPKHKGSKPSHAGVPATDPKPMACPFDSDKLHLDGHKQKK